MPSITDMRYTRALIVLATMALLAAACGGSASTDSTTAATSASSSSSTALTIPDSTTTATDTGTTVTTAATITTAESTTTTTLAIAASTTTSTLGITAAPSGTVIITADDGVYVATPTTATQLISYSVPPAFPSDLIDFAIGDTRGGVIIHPNRNPWLYKGTDSIVYWIPKGAAAAQQLLVSAGDQGTQLEDVISVGGLVSVYYTRLEGSLPEDMSQTLRHFDLDSKTVTPLTQVAGWESGAWNFSVGGNTIVNQWSGEGWGGFGVRDLTGASTPWAADPTAGGVFDCYPNCHVGVAVNPNGTKIAYAQRQAGVFWVTIINLADDSISANFSLPAGVYEIHSMDLGSNHLVVNRQEEGSEWYIEPLLVDLPSGGLVIDTIPLNGLARLTGVVPQLNGVVAFP